MKHYNIVKRYPDVEEFYMLVNKHGHPINYKFKACNFDDANFYFDLNKIRCKMKKLELNALIWNCRTGYIRSISIEDKFKMLD